MAAIELVTKPLREWYVRGAKSQSDE